MKPKVVWLGVVVEAAVVTAVVGVIAIDGQFIDLLCNMNGGRSDTTNVLLMRSWEKCFGEKNTSKRYVVMCNWNTQVHIVIRSGTLTLENWSKHL